MSEPLDQLRDLVPAPLHARLVADGLIPEAMLYELRMLYRDLTPNLGGEPSPESVTRARERAHAMIMRWGRGEFFS